MKHTEQLQPRPPVDPRKGTITVHNPDKKENSGGGKCCGGSSNDNGKK
jgi:hypothetical protein